MPGLLCVTTCNFRETLNFLTWLLASKQSKQDSIQGSKLRIGDINLQTNRSSFLLE